ncbi:hypothetical protein ACES2L_12605 [Bdellovibrio bacteriovorus]
MFLRNIVLALSLIIGFSAQAQTLTLLEAGRYELVDGEKELCADELNFSEKAVTQKSLALGGSYRFDAKNSQKIVESDLDANCEFREQTIHEKNSADETTLVRINQEVCAGKITSNIKSTATVSKLKLELTHDIQGSLPYTCIWKKADR